MLVMGWLWQTGQTETHAHVVSGHFVAFLFKSGDENILEILRRRWWRYLLLGLVDVEANYAVVKAYQYTTLTSVQVGLNHLVWCNQVNCGSSLWDIIIWKWAACFCPQLLDCFVIPVVMVLSWWILKIHYRPVHYVAVCICLLGVGAMVGADLLAGRDQGSSKDTNVW